MTAALEDPEHFRPEMAACAGNQRDVTAPDILSMNRRVLKAKN
jgi:hypothetical protein